ncbi:MAG: hypothetical protein Q9195_008102 [Heterodermia aff. obscurata]
MQWDCRVAPYIVVAFVDLISREICHLAKDLSVQLNRFLRAPRNSKNFVAKASTVAYHLGLIFTAALPLHADRRARQDAGSIFATLFPSIDTMLAQLQSIGKGLDIEGFRVGTIRQPMEILGVRISGYNSTTLDTGGRGESTRFEKLFIDFDSVLKIGSQRTRETPSSRSPPRATFQLGAESPGLESTPDEDPAEDPSIARPNLGTGSVLCSSLEQEALETKTRMILSQMRQEHSKLHDEIMYRQMKMAELENKIQLAELCLPPIQSRESPSLAKAVRQGLPDPELRAMSSPAAGVVPLTMSQADLTFSPSDQTLVERGQTAAYETQRMLSVTDHDIEMAQAPDVVNFNLQSPAGLEADDQEERDSCEITACDHVQPAATRPPQEKQSRKRRRVSSFFSSQSILLEPSSIAVHKGLPDKTKSDCDEMQQGRKHRFRGRNRVSRILLGQLCVLQNRLENIGTPPKISPPSLLGTSPLKTDLERPVSYPQSQRWRKSFGVSVKSLTEGFEKMRLKQNDGRVPSIPSP